jgi:NADP-dependent 3-hydroxy acid dehydrogenase YdfG
MKFNSKLVSFITGGASGLGEATVRRFNKLGVKIAVADSNEKRMLELKKELNSENIHWIKCDVS